MIYDVETPVTYLLPPARVQWRYIDAFSCGDGRRGGAACRRRGRERRQRGWRGWELIILPPGPCPRPRPRIGGYPIAVIVYRILLPTHRRQSFYHAAPREIADDVPPYPPLVILRVERWFHRGHAAAALACLWYDAVAIAHIHWLPINTLFVLIYLFVLQERLAAFNKYGSMCSSCYFFVRKERERGKNIALVSTTTHHVGRIKFPLNIL